MYVSPNVVKASALVASGLAVGGGAGYLLAKHRYDTKYRALAEDEIAEYKDLHNRRNKLGKYASPVTAMDDTDGSIVEYAEAVSDLDYGEPDVLDETLEEEFNRIQAQGKAARELREAQRELEETEEDATITAGQAEVKRILEAHGLSEDDSEDTEDEAVERAEVLQNIFDIPQDTIREEIKASRTSDKPYVIAVDEYMLGKDGFAQTTYMYYEADNTLTDERESILPEFEEYIGKENLSLFGFDSGDPNVVYVRNEKHRVDYEIVRNSGSYAELYGIGDEDHIDVPPKIRKMRNDRDG